MTNKQVSGIWCAVSRDDADGLESVTTGKKKYIYILHSAVYNIVY